MPQSLSNILIHIIFSTKNRYNWIISDIEKELYPYLNSICKSLNCNALSIGGNLNHVHILCYLSRTITISKLVERIKTGSSKWIKNKGMDFSKFSWQQGYGVFSTDIANVNSLKNYIYNQKEHHKTKNFKDELREFLNEHEIQFDERYLWD